MKHSRKRPPKKDSNHFVAFFATIASIAVVLWVFSFTAPQPPLKIDKTAYKSKPSITQTLKQSSKTAKRVSIPNKSSGANSSLEDIPTKLHLHKSQVNDQTRSLMLDEPALKKSAGKVALTFDAGASAEPTLDILESLRKNNVKATFFLTGKWALQNRKIAKIISDEGHEIGNHSHSHTHLEDLPQEEIIEDIRNAEVAIYESTGQKPAPFFRPPFGVRNRNLFDAARQAGYEVVMWDIDSWDSVKKDISCEEITVRVISKIKDGDIVLFHCGSRATADALPSILLKLKEMGFHPVKVSELRPSS